MKDKTFVEDSESIDKFNRVRNKTEFIKKTDTFVKKTTDSGKNLKQIAGKGLKYLKTDQKTIKHFFSPQTENPLNVSGWKKRLKE